MRETNYDDAVRDVISLVKKYKDREDAQFHAALQAVGLEVMAVSLSCIDCDIDEHMHEFTKYLKLRIAELQKNVLDITIQ